MTGTLEYDELGRAPAERLRAIVYDESISWDDPRKLQAFNLLDRRNAEPEGTAWSGGSGYTVYEPTV